MADHVEGQVSRLLLVPEPDEVGRVLAVVVADEDLADARDELARDAVEHPGERGRGVVRDHEDPHPFHRGQPRVNGPQDAPPALRVPVPVLRGLHEVAQRPVREVWVQVVLMMVHEQP